MRILLAGLAAAAALCAADTAAPWRFVFGHALPRWKDGLPVGNGRLGAQVWGSGPRLFLTLDRGDVWDLRYQPRHDPGYTYARLQQLVRERNKAAIQTEMNPDAGALSDLTPTRISIGRLEIELPEDTTVESAELDMQLAEVRWRLRARGQTLRYRVLAAADRDVLVVTLDGASGWTPRVSLAALGAINPNLGKKLGYPQPVPGKDATFSWVVQPMPESGQVATVWTTRAEPGAWTLLVTIPPQDTADPVAAGQQTLHAALERGTDAVIASHRAAWRERWARSAVHLPDAGLQRLWVNGIYKLASSSHGGAPANLQGLWPPDGEIPPWRGDYHCDMNVQETYWPAYSSNQLDLVEPLDRWLFEQVLPESEKLTRRFFGVDGVWVGTALDLKGRLLGGVSNWMTVQYWLGGGAWLGQHIWWQYAYSQDRDYLREHGYPALRKLVRFFENTLKTGPDGRLHVPLSSSPEYFSNDLEAWTPDPTCDLALIRNLLRYTARAAEALGVDAADRARWQKMDAQLAAYPADASGLKVQPDAPYSRSHRHPMHLFPIFPGEDLTVEGTAEDRALIDRSLHEWIFRGTGEWTGWSYPYGSLIASRARRPNQALNLLQIYEKAYIWPNGFHVNGDYKKFGFSFYTYEPFTEEAECAFTAAVNEMLLQSWGGRLRIFPAVPEEWTDVSFRDLRAQGGVLVSGVMRSGEIVSATLRAERGGEVKVVWPLGYVAPGQAFQEKTIRLGPGERRELVVR